MCVPSGAVWHVYDVPQYPKLDQSKRSEIVDKYANQNMNTKNDSRKHIYIATKYLTLFGKHDDSTGTVTVMSHYIIQHSSKLFL